MTDDLTPPTPEPLDDAARARLRERVLAGLDAPVVAHRRWVAPVAAAASVVALAGATGYVALQAGDDADGGGTGGAPAGQGTAPSSDDADTADTADTDAPTVPPSEGQTTFPTTVPPVDEGTPDRGQQPPIAGEKCVAEVRAVLPGAKESSALETETGGVVFYVSGDRYALCHTYGEQVTVHHPKPLAGGGEYDTFELSTDFVGRDGAAVLVAGGPAVDSPDFGVRYTFADGHVQDASLLVAGPPSDLWWVMVYPADDGTAATRGPIAVDVRGAEGSGELDLMDTCAQANHGC